MSKYNELINQTSKFVILNIRIIRLYYSINHILGILIEYYKRLYI